MRAPLARVSLAALASCATLGGAGGGDSNLPTSGVGPFQALGTMQVAAEDIAPFVFLEVSAGYREPSVLPATADPDSPSVLLYAAATTSKGDVIVRSRATDGRSFYGDTADDVVSVAPTPPVVLAASAPWEGAGVSGPSAVKTPSGEVWLYYAAAGGIGLARSTDGLTFTKGSAPVLASSTGVGWEFTPPRAPSVAVFPDGSWHMLYASGDAIGEATSPDGVAWARVDGDPSTPAFDPVLEPSAVVDPSTLPAGVTPPFDEGAVDDPVLAPRVDPAGRLQVRVLYTGYQAPLGAASRVGAIGFAARYGDSGALSKQAAPVYTATTSVSGPAYFEWSGLGMLYVEQDNDVLMPGTTFAAIAAAFSPATATLPALGAFPGSP